MRAVLVGLLFSLISTLSLGQSTTFYTDRALGVNPLQQTPTFLSYAQVRVCSLPLTTTSPCTPVAAVTDQFGNSISINGGNFGQLTTDTVGRFSFGCTPGNYQVQVAATGSNTPQLSYPVTCPSGTSLILGTANVWTQNQTFPAVNNVLYVGNGVGDIGAQINAAYASLPANGGVIVVVPKADNSCYSFTTPIVATVLGKYLLLVGMLAGGTATGCLNFTPTIGSAITFDYVPVGGSRGAVYGVKDLFLSNNLCTSIGGCGGSTTGITVSATNGGIDGAIMQNVTIQGFTVGYGENARVPSSEVQWTNPRFYNNGVGMNLFATAEEQIIGGTFYGNGNHIQSGDTNSQPELHITGTYFIAHSNEAFAFTNTSLGGTIYLTDVHLENGANSTINAHFVDGNVNIFGKGGVAEDDSSGGTADWWFNPNGLTFIWEGLEIVTASRNPTIGVLNLTVNTRAKLTGFVVNPVTLSSIVGGTNASKATVCMLSGTLATAASTCAMESPIQTPRVTFTLGVGADGGGFKHLRGVTGVATAASAGAVSDTTVTWATAFADANYTVTCSGNGTTSGVPISGGINSKLAGSVKFRTVAATAAAAQFTTVECMAAHD
jgi:hypothetical protein